MKAARRGRGAALLIAVLLILSVAIIAAVVGASLSASGITGTSHHASSVQAMYAAETGLERALKQMSTAAFGTIAGAGGLCLTGLATTQTLATDVTFATSVGSNKDFTGTVDLLNPYTQCRTTVTGAVGATSASRRLQAILDVSAIGGHNPSFNAPAGTGLPIGGWNVTPASGSARAAYDYTGGPDPSGAAPAACSRAIYAVRARQGGGQPGGFSRAKVNLATPFAVTSGQQVRVYFNWRGLEIDTGSAGCTIINSCPDPLVPGPGNEPAPCGDPGNANNTGQQNDYRFRFTLVDSAGVTSSYTFGSNVTSSIRGGAGQDVTTGAGCIPTTQGFPAVYATCATYYQQGTPLNKQFVDITVGGGGVRTIVRLRIDIYLGGAVSNRAREAWIDNVEVIPPPAGAPARVARTAEWRDCAVSTCP